MDDTIPSDAFSLVADRDCALHFGIQPAVYLHYLQYWCRRSRDGWCYRTQEQVKEWCGLNARTQLRYLNKLEGIIVVENRGGRNFCHVDEQRLYDTIYPDDRTDSPVDTDQTDCPNGSKTNQTDCPIRSDKLSEANNKEETIRKKTEKKTWPAFYQDVMNDWNSFATTNGLSTIIEMTDDRKKAVKSKAKHIWPRRREIYAKIVVSDFLMGRIPGKKFKANFTFLWVRQGNWAKLLEGDYDNNKFDKPHTNGTQRPVSVKLG